MIWSRVTLARMLAAAMENTRPSPFTSASAVTDASASMPAGTRLPSTATKTADEEDAEAAIFFAPFLRFPVGGGHRCLIVLHLLRRELGAHVGDALAHGGHALRLEDAQLVDDLVVQHRHGPRRPACPDDDDVGRSRSGSNKPPWSRPRRRC